MHALLTLLLVLLMTAAPALGQDRIAKVVLDDGTAVQGRVLQMSVSALQLEVDGKPVDIPAGRIATCSITVIEPPAPAPGDPGAAEGGDGGPAEPAAAEPNQAKAEPDPAVVNSRGPAADSPSRPGRVDRGAVLPQEAGHHSTLHNRLAALEGRYPWLAPVNPLQWCSLVVMSFTLLSLMLLLAAKAAGGEAVTFGRAVALTTVVMILGVAQFAWLPVGSVGAGIAVAGVDLSLLVLAFTMTFELGAIGGGVAVTLTALLSLLVVLGLELVTRVLASIGVVT